MESGNRHPLMRRQSNKRTFSAMSTSSSSHRDDTPSSDANMYRRDEQYENDHASRRRRFQEREEEGGGRRLHYPGDGLDFRRPVMSSTDARRDGNVSVNGAMNNAQVIDLTDEDGTAAAEESHASSERHGHGHAPDANADIVAPPATTAGSSSRAQRPPRFGRDDIIEVASSPSSTSSDSDAEEARQEIPRNLPGAQYLALPPLPTHPHRQNRHRPQYSSLRRPARPPSPPAEMDDIEFLSSRVVERPRSIASRQPTPAASALTRGQRRSLTPHPAYTTSMNTNEPIDLTNEDEDDVTVIDIRHRNVGAGLGVNRDPPARGLGFGNMGHIANILREQGENIGGRLWDRLHGIGGHAGAGGPGTLAEELRARALEDYQNNNEENHERHGHAHGAHRHGNHAHAHRHHHNHDILAGRQQGHLTQQMAAMQAALHANHHPPPAAPRPGVPPGMQIMMDYDMTAFDMGLPGGNRPPTPKYEAPPEPEKGFTRNPGEEEVVVCPNCGDELAVGEGETKQEIWVVKTCGHAYCGECALHRARTTSKKGKGKASVVVDPYAEANLPPAFKKCVVEGCGKSVAKNMMVHVYLGS